MRANVLVTISLLGDCGSELRGDPTHAPARRASSQHGLTRRKSAFRAGVHELEAVALEAVESQRQPLDGAAAAHRGRSRSASATRGRSAARITSARSAGTRLALRGADRVEHDPHRLVAPQRRRVGEPDALVACDPVEDPQAGRGGRAPRRLERRSPRAGRLRSRPRPPAAADQHAVAGEQARLRQRAGEPGEQLGGVAVARAPETASGCASGGPRPARRRRRAPCRGRRAGPWSRPARCRRRAPRPPARWRARARRPRCRRSGPAAPRRAPPCDRRSGGPRRGRPARAAGRSGARGVVALGPAAERGGARSGWPARPRARPAAGRPCWSPAPRSRRRPG